MTSDVWFGDEWTEIFGSHRESFALVIGNDLEPHPFIVYKPSSPRIPQVEDAFISFHVEHSFQEIVSHVDASLFNLSIGYFVNLIGGGLVWDDHLLLGH